MKGFKFRHWLSRRLPKRIEDPLLILESVKRGEPEAIEKMILGHMGLVTGLVARYNRANRSDELVSAAFYGLVNAVNRIASGHLDHHDPNPTAYIVTFVHGEIRRVLSEKSISVKTIQLPGILLPKGRRSRSNAVAGDRMDEFIGSHPDTTLDVEEKIKCIVSDKTDERIIELLRLGYDGMGIGKKLNLHRSSVSRRISRIRKIYRELENE